MENKNKDCPICGTNMLNFARYPNSICSECCDQTVTEKNDKIEFYNDDHTGGFISVVNNVKGSIHECYVNNIKCYADEARFGGIVISVVV